MLAPSFIAASHQQFLWCSVVERLEHLVLSVCCLLTPLMSPKDMTCKLIVELQPYADVLDSPKDMLSYTHMSLLLVIP